MAIVGKNLTAADSAVSGSSFATASITPGANHLILATFESRTAITANPNQPTASGCGLTWVVVRSLVYDTTSSTRKRITVFRAMGPSPSTGAITFDEGGQTQTNASWSVEDFTGMDMSGVAGAGAIVQSADNKDETVTTNTLTVTLAAFSNINNATFGVFANDNNPGLTSVGSGFTKLGDTQAGAGENLVSEYKSTNDTTVDITWVNNAILGGIAIEIKAYTGLIGFDATANSGEITSVSSKTQALTVGNLVNGAAFIRIATRGGTLAAISASSVTFNSLSCSLIRSDTYDDGTDAGRVHTEIWGVAVGTLATGSYNAVVTFGGTITRGVVEVSSWNTVDQLRITEAVGGNNVLGQASPLSNSVTTISDNAYLIDSLYTKTGGAITKGASQTQDANVPVNAAGDQVGMSHRGPVTPPASTSMSWTYAAADDYAQSIAVIKPLVVIQRLYQINQAVNRSYTY